ncbi:hypothetical protein CVT26_009481 [Gymnopilus dilepis]|uniref:INO80 complex subunit F domain-containing protein n=1 Tax=Gymnopilus dilepis TaxID=231916 RepID=A0A409VJY4_9AGAR|nr:hypothetical protein CVT26_009481 [Gymnopilus dilepis]
MSPVPSPAPPSQSQLAPPARQKQKLAPVGIAAGAEDAKYHAKYKELKRKVKDVEADNDKLHFKILQAKLSIRRMKMERAVLYERLSQAPPSPPLQDHPPLPPTHHNAAGPLQPSSRQVSGSHQHREMRMHPSAMDPDQIHAPQEHIRSQGSSRIAPVQEARPVPVMDEPMGSTAAYSPHMSVHSPRRASGGHDGGRHHLPALPPMPPSVQHQYDVGRGHSHSNSHASPPLHHAHSGSSHSHSRNRSHSSSRSRSQNVPPPAYRVPGQPHHYPESLPPVHQPMHSPPLSERERPRHTAEPHEYADPHAYDRHPTRLPLSPGAHPSDSRSAGRIHAHQRLGPGTYINREEYHDKQRDRDFERQRERDWELERERERERDRPREYTRSGEMSASHMHSPPLSAHRSHSQIDRGDYEPHMPPRSREEPAYYHDSLAPSGYPRLSRSDTPGSGSASGSGAGAADVPSRPDSRSQYYERGDRTRSSTYRLRAVPQQHEDVADFSREEGRSQQVLGDRAPVGGGGGGGNNFSVSEHSHPSLDSRKRGRNDMDVDSDNDVGGDMPPSGSAAYASGRLQEDRGSKRYQREHHRRSVDDHEEARMGPS